MTFYQVLVHGRCSPGPNGGRGFFAHCVVEAADSSSAGVAAFSHVRSHTKYHAIAKEWGPSDLEVDELRTVSAADMAGWKELGWILYDESDD